MDGQHSARPGRHGLGDELRAHEERLGVDVDEHRARAAELNGVGRGGERVRGHDHLVSRSDPKGEEREMDRRRSGGDRNRLRSPDRSRERGLEGGHLWPHRQLSAREHVGDGRELRLADIGPGEPDRAARPGPWRLRERSSASPPPTSPRNARIVTPPRRAERDTRRSSARGPRRARHAPRSRAATVPSRRSGSGARHRCTRAARTGSPPGSP